MPEICDNCKKPFDFHTQEELLKCKLILLKNSESKITDEDVTRDFNEIKSGEFSRMYEGQKRKENGSD